MDLTIYFEVLVLIDVLLGNVFRDHIVRYVTAAAAEVASRPQVASPKLLLQMWELGQQMVRRAAFQPLRNRLIVTGGGSEINRCTWSFDTCPFMIDTSCCPQMSRIRSRTRVATFPFSAGLRYFVIHTRCRWISNTVCAPRRYSAIPEVYPARTR
jgi:hypothetical protein